MMIALRQQQDFQTGFFFLLFLQKNKNDFFSLMSPFYLCKIMEKKYTAPNHFLGQICLTHCNTEMNISKVPAKH